MYKCKQLTHYPKIGDIIQDIKVDLIKHENFSQGDLVTCKYAGVYVFLGGFKEGKSKYAILKKVLNHYFNPIKEELIYIVKMSELKDAEQIFKLK